MLNNLFANSKNRIEDHDLANRGIISAVSIAGLIIAFVYMRPSDWLSTALWYDSLGFQFALNEQIEFLGRLVSQEGLIFSIAAWLLQLILMYRAYLSGPWYDSSQYRQSPTKWGKMMVFANTVNMQRLYLFIVYQSIAQADNVTDAAWKAGGFAAINVLHFCLSAIQYGFMSEWLLGYSAKTLLENVIYFRNMRNGAGSRQKRQQHQQQGSRRNKGKSKSHGRNHGNRGNQGRQGRQTQPAPRPVAPRPRQVPINTQLPGLFPQDPDLEELLAYSQEINTGIVETRDS